MGKCDILIPVTTYTEATYAMACVAVRTCRASVSPDEKVIAVLNNSPKSPRETAFREECGLLGIDVWVWPGQFNFSSIFNQYVERCRTPFLAYGSSDVIYYPGWLDAILAAWEKHPDFWFMCNYTFHADGGLPCARRSVQPEDRVVKTHNPSSGVLVYRLANGWRYDERFPLWEADADLTLWMQHNGKTAGCCYNARCDHLLGAVKVAVPSELWGGCSRPAELLREKWKL